MQTITSHSHLQIEPSVLYFGTPVSLISTLNPDGGANLAPMSSTWYLGKTAVLGVADGGQTLPNLRRTGECVLNLPSSDMHEAVERLAPLTGRRDVPPHKRDRFRYEKDKFRAAGLSEVASTTVAPPRVAECPVQLEGAVEQIHDPVDGGFAIVEVRVSRVRVALARTASRCYPNFGREGGASARADAPRSNRRANYSPRSNPGCRTPCCRRWW